MADIGRQRQRVTVHLVPSCRDGGFERAHAEAVAKVVKPRPSLTGTASKADLAGESDEGLGYVAGVRRSPGRDDEQVIVRPGVSLPDCQIPIERLAGGVVERNEPALVEMLNATF